MAKLYSDEDFSYPVVKELRLLWGSSLSCQSSEQPITASQSPATSTLKGTLRSSPSPR